MYNSLHQLPKSTQHLPYNGKRIFLKFYNRGLKMTRSDVHATQLAWIAVKRKYYKHNGQWVPYADDNEFDTTTTDESDNDDESNETTTTINDDDTTTTAESSETD
ncbi:Cation transporter protein A [Perigonia lusca single nucleopolyhedrovirus]|uniref:Cation transporter protein A n=1 Tax=Perigonia lusca single nucleopolyhedrovirus TaxID=1675865 RepID=A0A0M3N106_9ABAC|nr:Cation transporter protein A [Perigonia lusca single nucleopolyhedrovirus]AKN80573.1 Cation transporter protein A [Perigonia lusca single nucleopolyhedrovirus]